MEKAFYYKYEKMELGQFATFEDKLQPGTSDVQFTTQVQFAYDKQQNVICCEMEVLMSQPGEATLMKAVMRSYFSIHAESVKNMQDDKGQIVFAPHILIQFASLNYGAMRGVIFVKTEQSLLSRFILPPVFFDEIINKPFIVTP